MSRFEQRGVDIVDRDSGQLVARHRYMSEAATHLRILRGVSYFDPDDSDDPDGDDEAPDEFDPDGDYDYDDDFDDDESWRRGYNDSCPCSGGGTECPCAAGCLGCRDYCGTDAIGGQLPWQTPTPAANTTPLVQTW